MKILYAVSAVFLIACYGTGAKPDTTSVDSDYGVTQRDGTRNNLF